MDKNLHWNVYRDNFNKHEIEIFNVFTHGRFNEAVTKLLKKKIARDEFSKELKFEAQYCFWSRSEYEIIATSWPPYIDKEELDRLNTEYEEYNTKWGHYPYRTDVRLTVGSKIDIYDQLMLNWDRFADYVWSFVKHKTEE